MGAYLANPQTDKETACENDTHFRVGSSSMQGWRQHQEDAHRVILEFGNLKEKWLAANGSQRSAKPLSPESGLFSVMDGHGGADVSAYAASILEEVFFQNQADEESPDDTYQNIIMTLDKRIREHFTANCNNASEGDENMSKALEDQLQEAKSTGMTREKATQLMMKVLYYQQKDKKESNLSDSMGCTCVTSLIIPRMKDGKLKYHVKATNSGDSRVLVWDQATDTVHGTRDHKPNDPEEKKRIETAGGEVRETNAGGDRVQYRVNGNLNLCRALGDYEYKKRDDLPASEQMITSCPDVYTWELQEGDIVVLACDGIFDVLSNEQVIQNVRDRIDEKDLGTICEEIMTECLADDPRQSHGIGGDNMTIMIVHLTGTGTTQVGKWPANKLPPQEVESPEDVDMPQVAVQGDS